MQVGNDVFAVMSENSSISWTDHTFNPWEGCTKVSPACLHCYAETMVATRYGRVKWGKGEARRRTSEANWRKPIAWNKSQARHQSFMEGTGERPRVFCASLADWLDDEVPIEWLSDLLALIHATPNLDWLLLTKRPQNWRTRLDAVAEVALQSAMTDEYMGAPFEVWLGDWIDEFNTPKPPANVWMGTTVEDQARADERIPILLKIPAMVRFLSCEPLLGAVDLNALPDPKGDPSWDASALYGVRECVFGAVVSRENIPRVEWVICGGESGHGARQTEIAWIRSLKDQCADAGVAFHCKQITEKGRALPMERWPDDLRVQEFPEEVLA